ncbi:TetR/AcrR family transcriptional regulator [Gordonia sp. CPCC 205515]|uniref:TetR/AcrR family transcriptional regulator n=1 Tax=Gordonia sp. CPCC 205515 TaxID=3140791 RepID=UPI003AF3A830
MATVARPRVHTADLRERLVEEATTIVEREGWAALSVRSVAGAADTSTTAVYSLFGSKDDLARRVLIAGFESFAAAQESADTDDIGALGIAYVGWALEHPRLFEMMFGTSVAGIEPSDELTVASRRSMAPLHTAVRDAVDRGVFVDADAETIVASLWAQVHGLAVLLLAGRFPDGADPVAAGQAIVNGWKR